MSRKNIANFTTFNTLYLNTLEIQHSGLALSIYDNDANNPIFAFNTATKTFTVDASLTVTGEASFETIAITEFDNGIQILASTNIGDATDIGVAGAYNDGTTKYTGIIRDASDTFKRWTFFEDIDTKPTTSVAGLDSTKFASFRGNYLYVNDGSAASPSITFNNDTNNDTGFYLIGENEMGISAGGSQIASFKYNSGSSTQIQLGATTSLKLQKIDTIDDAASGTVPTIDIGHIYLLSANANDKWLKFYSATAEITPAYSGTVYTSSSDNYFITNSGGTLTISRNSTVASSISCPDYRDATLTQLMVFNGTTSTETKLPLIIPFGSLGNLSLKFAGETTTGLYRSAVNTIALVCNGTNIVNISPTDITFTQELYNINGTLAAPSITFTANNDVGFYRDVSLGRENISISIDGIDAGKFTVSSTTPQFVMPIAGTKLLPSYAFTDYTTGIYSPTDEASSGHIAFSLGGVETLRLRRRIGTISQGLGNIEFFNSVVFTPGGSSAVAAIYVNDTRINNNFKAYNSSFQSYNLIDESLLLIYTFRSTGTVGQDYSNNGITASVVGSPTIKSSEKDTNSVVKRDVLDFTGNTGSTQYLNLTSNLSSFTTIDQATIAFWFKISGTLSNDNTILDCYKTTGSKHISIKILSDAAVYPNAIQVTIESDSITTLEYHTATSADSGTPSPISIKDGLWHHFAVHMGSNTGSIAKHTIYLDGVELNIASNTLYFTSNGDNNSQPELSSNSFNDLSFNYIAIGAFYNGTTGDLGYTGYLKDFYITRRLLSASEITTLSIEPIVYMYKLDVAQINVSDFSITNQCLFGDGTASLPSFAFTDDTNTGIYRAATNTIGFSTNGAERLTIADTLIQFNTNDFEVDSSKNWMKLTMSSGAFGPRIVFQHNTAIARHSIRTQHQNAIIDGNYMDFYLYDTGALDADGLGNNQVMRLAVSSATSNSAIQTIYGISRVYDGTVSSPAFSFTNSTGLGLYRISNNDMGLSAAGVLKLEINSVVTVGNASGDTTTKLYVPLGTQALPSISFIGDTNTGIFSSTDDNIDISCGNTLITNFSTAGLTNQTPIIVDVTSTAAFIIRKDGAVAGGDILTVDTTNSRVGFGYTGLYIDRFDTYNSIASQRLNLGCSTAITNSLGIAILNTNGVGSNTDIASLILGKDQSTRNYINTYFNYVSSGSTSNRLVFSFAGVGTEQLNIKADGTVNVVGSFTVTSTATFSDQIIGSIGSASTPTFTFFGDLTTGIYSPSAQQIGFATNGVIRRLITNNYEEIYNPIRLSNGSTSAPALTFSSDTSQDSGLYYISNNRFGISNGSQSTWIWDNRGTAPHECLNELYIKPNGTNIRAYFQDKKLRASSNQNILNILPILHYKFITNDPNTQDESINKYIIEATTATYLSTVLTLTDVSGIGLLQYYAVQLSTASTDRIETSSIIAELQYLTEYQIGIKFKPTSNTAGNLFEIYGNRDGSTSSNYIRVSISSNNVNIVVHNGTSIILNASSASGNFTINTWFNLVLDMRSTGNSFSVNGSALSLNYTVGSSATTFAPSNFGSTANFTVIVGGASNSFLTYISEFYIAPYTTTETVDALYRVQAHEIYTNKLQLATTTQGLVDEGYILRSDKGNNAIWDNSLQIKGGFVQIDTTKLFRVPAGSATLPAISFILDTTTGIFSGGTNSGIFSIATNGVQRLSISTSQMNLSSTNNMLINNTTLPTTNDTGALIVAGGIGLGNGSSTASRINFGSGYTITSQAANRMVALYDSTNNNYQFFGFGIQSGILSYNVSSNSDNHIFYCGASSSTQSELFRITGSGVALAQNGVVGAPAFSFVNSPTTGLYRIGSDNIGISAAGSKVLDISTSITQISNELQLTSGFRKNVSVESSTSLSLDATYCIVEFSYATNSSNVIVTLPQASSNIGREYTLIKTGNGGGNLVINTFSGTEYIDDNSTTQIILSVQFDKVTLICNGTNRWYTI